MMMQKKCLQNIKIKKIIKISLKKYDKQDSQKSDTKAYSLFTEKGLNDIPVQKDKVQPSSNKKD